jgi:hypothetical protein
MRSPPTISSRIAWCAPLPSRTCGRKAQHDEFSEAVNRAKAKRARWWEEQALAVAQSGGPGGQATMVIFGLKNHAPEDYKDKTEQEITIRGELAERLDDLRKRRSTQG